MTKDNIVTIGGQNYKVDDPRITTDHFTGAHILRDAAVLLYTTVHLDNRRGFVTAENEVFTMQSLARLIENGQVIEIYTAGSRYRAISNYELVGNGTLYAHPVAQQRRVGRVYDLTAYNNLLTREGLMPRNPDNKFRAFDNQVRAFKDFDNEFISDQDKSSLLQRNFMFGVDSPTYKIFEGLRYTFGVELETSSGRLTEEEAQGLNLKCEFDGSLRETPDQRREDVLGGEYITGVLKGDSGMFQLQKICTKLSEKCTINEKCGVHVHIGDIKLNKENVIYLYRLGEMIQDEVYEMLPTSRRKNVYCRKIKELKLDVQAMANAVSPISRKIYLDENYCKVFKEVSHGGEPSKQSNKRNNHPMGSKCGYDKATQRYCWLNFVTLMFNTKGNPNAMTLEFRSHSATLNYKKVKNWVRICMAIVSFAENHKASIKRGYWLDANKTEHNINLSTIVKAAYPKTYKTLENYIADRKSKFFYDKGDIEKQEYATDKEDIKFLTRMEDAKCV